MKLHPGILLKEAVLGTARIQPERAINLRRAVRSTVTPLTLSSGVLPTFRKRWVQMSATGSTTEN